MEEVDFVFGEVHELDQLILHGFFMDDIRQAAELFGLNFQVLSALADEVLIQIRLILEIVYRFRIKLIFGLQLGDGYFKLGQELGWWSEAGELLAQAKIPEFRLRVSEFCQPDTTLT